MATTQDPRVELRSVSLAFGGVQALRDVTFTVDIGETLGVVGPNGAGKSSLINCLTGFYVPDAGHILVNEIDVVGLKPWRISALGLARTFQQTNVIVDSTVLENVLLGKHGALGYGLASASVRSRRVRRQECLARDEALQLLDMVGIGHLAEHSMQRLTFGQRKLVEVARALISKPRFLFLDEPVSGMTFEEKREVTGAIDVIHRSTDVGIIVIEHDLWFVQTVCGRAVALDFGRVIGNGQADEVLRSEELVAAYLGQAPEPARRSSDQ
jgi:branched-chain amino acid transport system ATP-binding protein